MNSHRNQLQINAAGQLQHLLAIEGLPRPWIEKILETADNFVDHEGKITSSTEKFAQKIVANLFFEASTRTRSTFELAAKHLGASVLNLNINSSATTKGESLLDTVHNLEAMGVNTFVIRHSASGAPLFAAQHLKTNASIINAGDGCHEHPSQALLEMLTIRRHRPDFSELTVVIIGDILHSRVARSQIHALTTLGVGKIRVVAPATLLPTKVASLGVEVHHDLISGLRDADVVTVLRLQEERMQSGRLPSKSEYYRLYGLTPEKLSFAKPNALVMHPGPINRGVEIASAVADGMQSVILQQVQLGIAIRMAIMSLLFKCE